MGSSCPYCGAVLKLKFCVVCGRHSRLNKMGQIISTARNTDVTQRLEDPFFDEEVNPQKSLRFHQTVRPIMEAILSGLIAGTLIFCAAKQALDFYDSADQISGFLSPWMRSHRFAFPNTWQLPNKQQADATYKAEMPKRRQHKSNKLKGR